MTNDLCVVAPARCLALAAILAASSLSAQSNPHPHSWLLPETALREDTRLELQLHGGDYEVRPSHSGSISVIETRDPGSTQRPTSVHFGVHDRGALLTIDPPTGEHSPHVVIELPLCSDLNLHLTAGELNFTSPACTHTTINLHAGELIANMGPVSGYSNIHASVTIGQIQAPQLGQHKDGFFNSINLNGAGQRTLSAHVGSGDIILKSDSEPHTPVASTAHPFTNPDAEPQAL